MLDILYQQYPLNQERILGVFDLIDKSCLAAEVKEKYYSRRYEFLDDLGTDVNKSVHLTLPTSVYHPSTIHATPSPCLLHPSLAISPLLPSPLHPLPSLLNCISMD